MKNKLSDLADQLYEQIERLNDEGMTDEQLKTECERAKAISSLAGNIIDIATVSVSALRLVSGGIIEKGDLPALLKSAEDKPK